MQRSAEELGREIVSLRADVRVMSETIQRVRKACADQASLNPDMYSRGYLLGAAEAGATILSALEGK